ncbi:MAG TPA: metal-dependent hydrolase [Hymenobacter sp.]|jgi:L-ascorbate metabolism protein UlaG (beta-lactamase superfamily)
MLQFFLLGVLWLTAGAVQGQARGSVRVQWLGHAAFEITSPGGTVLLLDPYLTQNPNTPDSLKRLGRYHPAAIVVSHSHADHFGDALALAKANRVKIISPRMTAVYGPETLADSLQLIFNVGGTVQVGDVRVSAVPAMHSSDFGGRPIGIILSFTNGETIYHTGDTWVFSDMALIQEFYHPTILLLGVGGGAFGQDAATARAAVRKYFRPRVIIPMHYGPVPFRLATEADIRAAFAGDKRVRVLQPGQSARFGR